MINNVISDERITFKEAYTISQTSNINFCAISFLKKLAST